jgi:hypothetical protein
MSNTVTAEIKPHPARLCGYMPFVEQFTFPTLCHHVWVQVGLHVSWPQPPRRACLDRVSLHNTSTHRLLCLHHQAATSHALGPAMNHRACPNAMCTRRLLFLQRHPHVSDNTRLENLSRSRHSCRPAATAAATMHAPPCIVFTPYRSHVARHFVDA